MILSQSSLLGSAKSSGFNEGMFPPPGMPSMGVLPPAAMPPPFLPGLHVPPSPFAPPQPFFASTPIPPTSLSNSSSNVPRAGGSVYLEMPPPAPKPSTPTSKPRKEPKNRKRRYSYDHSDLD